MNSTGSSMVPIPDFSMNVSSSGPSNTPVESLRAQVSYERAEESLLEQSEEDGLYDSDGDLTSNAVSPTKPQEVRR